MGDGFAPFGCLKFFFEDFDRNIRFRVVERLKNKLNVKRCNGRTKEFKLSGVFF